MCFWINQSSLHEKKETTMMATWFVHCGIPGCDPRAITCCVFMPLTLMAPKYDGEIYTEEFYN